MPLKLHVKCSTCVYICIFLGRRVFSFYMIFFMDLWPQNSNILRTTEVGRGLLTHYRAGQSRIEYPSSMPNPLCLHALPVPGAALSALC